jgi:hypothetical protein
MKQEGFYTRSKDSGGRVTRESMHLVRERQSLSVGNKGPPSNDFRWLDEGSCKGLFGAVVILTFKDANLSTSPSASRREAPPQEQTQIGFLKLGKDESGQNLNIPNKETNSSSHCWLNP